MNYPTQLLPCPKYKAITCDLSACHVVRFFKSGNGVELLDENDEVIVNNFITRKDRLIDISTFLVGIFEPDHIQISLTKQGREVYDNYCEPDAEVEAPINPDHFELDTDRKKVFLEISELHLKEIPFENEDTKLNYVCHVVHSPKLYNFWHFSIRWHDGEGFLVDRIREGKVRKKTHTKRIEHLAKVFLKSSASYEIAHFEVVPEVEYLK